MEPWELDEILRSPQTAQLEEDANRTEYSSAPSQLVLEFQEHAVTLADVSGELPVRSVFVEGLASLLHQLQRHSLLVHSFEWNLSGALPDAITLTVISKLFDVEMVDRVLGGEIEPYWTTPELHFGFWFGENPTDFRMLKVTHMDGNGIEDPMQFTFNATFAGPVDDQTGTAEQGQSIVDEAITVLDRLIGEQEGY